MGELAMRPEDLARFFVARANAGDVDGLVALYERDAVLALPDGRRAEGRVAIRAFYQRLLADRPTFAAGDQQPALRKRHHRHAQSRRQKRPIMHQAAQTPPLGRFLQ